MMSVISGSVYLFSFYFIFTQIFTIVMQAVDANDGITIEWFVWARVQLSRGSGNLPWYSWLYNWVHEREYTQAFIAFQNQNWIYTILQYVHSIILKWQNFFCKIEYFVPLLAPSTFDPMWMEAFHCVSLAIFTINQLQVYCGPGLILLFCFHKLIFSSYCIFSFKLPSLLYKGSLQKKKDNVILFTVFFFFWRLP